MAKQKAIKPRQVPPNVETSVAIADVPVKITFMQGDKMLAEYEDVIDLEFSRELKKRRCIRKLDGRAMQTGTFN